MPRKTAAEMYGTDPSGVLAAGPPGGGGGGSGFSASPTIVSSGPVSTLGGMAGNSASSGPGLSISAGAPAASPTQRQQHTNLKAKGGKVKKMAKGGSVSKRADGCCTKGKTRGKFR